MSSGYGENKIRQLLEAQRAMSRGIPPGLMDQRNLKPPVVEGVPPPPPRPAWMGGQQPQQIFPAPGDFQPEPPPPLRSVLKRDAPPNF